MVFRTTTKMTSLRPASSDCKTLQKESLAGRIRSLVQKIDRTMPIRNRFFDAIVSRFL